MNDFSFTPAQQHKALRWLVLFHIAVIASSNYLVQFPFTITLPNGFAVHSTWGALSFPFIFLATDLTVRIFGQRLARRIIFRVMFPALLLSYVISVLFHDGTWTGWGSLADFQPLVFRIALASFAAYAFGQVMDIFVFNRLRQMKAWWVAPTASTFAGNALDTVLFFSIAFHASSDPFMAENWPHIALVDYLFKLAICTLMFVPAYGVLLNVLTRRLTALRSGAPGTHPACGSISVPGRGLTQPARQALRESRPASPADAPAAHPWASARWGARPARAIPAWPPESARRRPPRPAVPWPLPAWCAAPDGGSCPLP